MPTVVVIPVKSFRLAKQRLSPTLDEQQREALGQALAGHTASQVESAGLLPLIVTADPQVAEWATVAGFPSLADPGTGLDDAARVGTEWAMASDSSWIVLHSDLPLLDRDDVIALDTLSHHGLAPLAPSADGGTSAIGSIGGFDFSYGPGSFHTHLARLPDAAVVFRVGLAHDVDSPNDLTTAMATTRGRWLAESIA